MPQPPHIEGLPLWAQIVISLLFGIAALGAAYSGYFKKGEKAAEATNSPTTTALLAASITDMGAIRHLSDVCIVLTGAVQALGKCIDEQTYHARNDIEIKKELCARLRQLSEETERLGSIVRAQQEHR